MSHDCTCSICGNWLDNGKDEDTYPLCYGCDRDKRVEVAEHPERFSPLEIELYGPKKQEKLNA